MTLEYSRVNQDVTFICQEKNVSCQLPKQITLEIRATRFFIA